MGCACTYLPVSLQCSEVTQGNSLIIIGPTVLTVLLHVLPAYNAHRDNPSCHLRINENIVTHKRICGGILDAYSLRILEKRNIFYPLMLIIHNTKPIGHQVLVHVFSNLIDSILNFLSKFC